MPTGRDFRWGSSTLSESVSNSLLHQRLRTCGHFRSGIRTFFACCDRASNCWHPQRKICEGHGPGDAIRRSILSLPGRYLAAGDHVQDPFWGMCHVMLLVRLAKWHISQHLGNLSQLLVELFDSMSAEEPGSRPPASAALSRVREIQLGLPDEVLLSEVPYSPIKMRLVEEEIAKLNAEI